MIFKRKLIKIVYFKYFLNNLLYGYTQEIYVLSKLSIHLPKAGLELSLFELKFKLDLDESTSYELG